jgi:tape measure domain-containing protein
MARTVETRMTLRETVTGTLARINRGTLDYRRSLRELRSTANETWSSIKTGATLAAAAFGAAGAAAVGLGIKTNAELEKSAMSFEILLQSGDKAKKMVSDLQSLALESPFDFVGLQNSAKKLLGMGFAGNQVIPIMHSLGNAVAATGGNTEQLEGIALALGQINSKGKVSAEEMNQLAERGIPAWQLLSKQMGKSTAELMKMGEQGELLANDAIPALVKGLDERFAGSMKKMSDTWDYTIANMKESISIGLASISLPLFNTIKKDLQGVQSTIQQMSKDGSLQEWGNKASSVLVDVYNKAKAIGMAIWEVGSFVVNNWSTISPIVYGIVGAFVAYKAIVIGVKAYTMAYAAALWVQTTAQLGLNAAMRANPIGFIVTLIGLAIVAGTYLINNWEQVKLVGMNTWNTVVDAAQWSVNALSNIGNIIIQTFKFAWDNVEFAGKSIWNGILGAGQVGVNGFINLVNSMIDKSLSGINYLISGANNLGSKLGLSSSIPELSFGGIGKVDFSGAMANAEKPKWDSEFNLLPKVDFSGAKFSDDSIMNQTKKAQAERDKNKQKSEDKLAESLDKNTAATSENTGETDKNTKALKETQSAEDIADSLFGRIDRQLYGTT